MEGHKRNLPDEVDRAATMISSAIRDAATAREEIRFWANFMATSLPPADLASVAVVRTADALHARNEELRRLLDGMERTIDDMRLIR